MYAHSAHASKRARREQPPRPTHAPHTLQLDINEGTNTNALYSQPTSGSLASQDEHGHCNIRWACRGTILTSMGAALHFEHKDKTHAPPCAPKRTSGGRSQPFGKQHIVDAVTEVQRGRHQRIRKVRVHALSPRRASRTLHDPSRAKPPTQARLGLRAGCRPCRRTCPRRDPVCTRKRLMRAASHVGTRCPECAPSGMFGAAPQWHLDQVVRELAAAFVVWRRQQGRGGPEATDVGCLPSICPQAAAAAPCGPPCFSQAVRATSQTRASGEAPVRNRGSTRHESKAEPDHETCADDT